MRDFWRFHFLKVIIGLVVIQLLIFAWLQHRNHRPKAVVDEVKVFEGQSVKIRPLTNDTDKDDDELTLEDVSEPLHGKITQDENLLVYTAGRGFAGVDSFTYVANDGKKDSREEYIKVTVDENLKPVAKDDNATLYGGGETILNILANDNDREDDSIFIHEISNPIHGELIRQGDKFIYKSNGTVGDDSIQYAISDGFNNSEKATVHIEVKSKNNPCYPWLSADVGRAPIPGSLACKSGKFVIEGSGTDIWGNADGFQYVYKYVNGDFEISTKIESMDNTHQWAKAGIMVRETKDANSKNATVGITPANGALLQYRTETGARTTSVDDLDKIKAPYWVKMVRRGDTFKSFISPDGQKWKMIMEGPLPIPKNVYLGFAVCSQNAEKLCKTVFSNIRSSSKPAKLVEEK